MESEKVVPDPAAIQTIIKYIKERGDGKHKLVKEDSRIVVHRSCRKQYTKSFMFIWLKESQQKLKMNLLIYRRNG